MLEVGGELTRLWDRAVGLAERVDAGQWGASTPCPGMDVSDLVAHLALAGSGAPYRAGGRQALLDRLRVTRERDLAEIAGLTGAAGATGSAGPGPSGTTGSAGAARRLDARCLDSWVHAYDLGAALDDPLDLAAGSAVVDGAARGLLRLTPRLFSTALGAVPGAAVRLELDGAAFTPTTVLAAGGAWAEEGAAPANDVVAGSPAAFVLLLSGRGTPEGWRAAGLLDWRGPSAETFVRRVRAPGAG